MRRACPECGSNHVRGAARHGRDPLGRVLLYRPLRCRDCRHRFWIFNPIKPLLLAATLGAMVAGTVWLARAQRLPSAPVAVTSDAHVLAEQGQADAQYRLGVRYAEGDGLVPNDREAAKWFGRAARQGLADAQYRYGLALLNGKGVVQDYKAAFDWIEKAAQQGHSHAQYWLGDLFRHGTGTAPDKARAYLWFNVAAAQGVDAAIKARDHLAWQLHPDQVIAMQEEARRIAHLPSPGSVQAAQAD